MNDERDTGDIERLLQSVPAPAEVPAGLEAVARAAALDPERGTAVTAGPARAAFRQSRWGSLRWGRLVPAACVLVGAAAASLVIGVGGRGQGISVQSTVALRAAGTTAGAAHASLQLGNTNGPMRPIVFTVSGLRPASPGKYYEMWFSSGKEKVGMLAFNTGADGSVTVRGEIPISMTWSRCWVTLEDGLDGHEGQRPVLTSV
jgi:hypothetical protein